MQKYGIPCEEAVAGGDIKGLIRPAEGIETPDEENESAEDYEDVRIYL
jgi:hypothetical protein